jgi:hypothetical protein
MNFRYRCNSDVVYSVKPSLIRVILPSGHRVDGF